MKNSLLSFLTVSTLALMLVVNIAAAESEQTNNTEDDSSTTEVIKTTSINNRTTVDVGSIQELIKSLLERIKLLQGDNVAIKTEIKETSEEIRDLLKSNFRVGSSGENVRKVQEILASDKDIYPRGLVTGYYGPMTEEAIKKFQVKFDLEVTGEINDETREAMNALLEERKANGQIPPGLLKAPGIMKKFTERLREGCDDDSRAKGPFCIAMKKKHNWEEKKANRDSQNDDDSGEEKQDKVEQTNKVGTYLEKRAEASIEAAEKTIALLEKAIDEAEDDADGTDEAELDLATAKTALEAAEDYLADKKYVSATKKAQDAKRAAHAGLSELD